jgi:hypothetical protein
LGGGEGAGRLTFWGAKQDEVHGFHGNFLSVDGILDFQDIPCEIVILNGNAKKNSKANHCI